MKTDPVKPKVRICFGFSDYRSLKCRISLFGHSIITRKLKVLDLEFGRMSALKFGKDEILLFYLFNTEKCVAQTNISIS